MTIPNAYAATQKSPCPCRNTQSLRRMTDYAQEKKDCQDNDRQAHFFPRDGSPKGPFLHRSAEAEEEEEERDFFFSLEVPLIVNE